MFPYLVFLLILSFLPVLSATLLYIMLDISQLLANLLTELSICVIILPIVSCNLDPIKIIILLFLLSLLLNVQIFKKYLLFFL